MKHLKLVLCVFAFPFILSCSSDSDSDEIIETPSEKPAGPKYLPLNVEVGEIPMNDPTASSNTGTHRAPITFLSDLSNFYLNYIYEEEEEDEMYYYYNEKVWKADNDGKGRWKVGESGQYGWPENAAPTTSFPENGKIPVTWYAYANYDVKGDNVGFQVNDNDPYIPFTVEESSTSQKDLLVSEKTDTWDNCKGNMYFLFSHVCSALKFHIKKATNVKERNITVTEVKLHNVKNHGQFYFRSKSWASLSGAGYYTLLSSTNAFDLSSTEYRAMYAGTLSQDTENAYLFMLPQSLSAWNPAAGPVTSTTGAYLELNFIMDGRNLTGYVPFQGTFEQGYKHNVNINLGKNSLYHADGSKIISE